MQTLAQRFYDLKTRVGGNRENTSWEQQTGMPLEMQYFVTMPNKDIRRIIAQVEFALKLSASKNDSMDKYIDEALTILCNGMDKDGVLTKQVCETAQSALLPMQKAAEEYELILAAHAHIDMNWMWGWQETVAATLSTFRTMLDLMNEYPDFTYSQSQASVYKIVEDYDPDMMDEIKKRIKEGRWEVTATAWVETDKNMPNTESLLRHIRYTRDYLKDVWGVDPKSLEVDFSPDTFGHSAQLPEIDGYGNVKYYYHCRAHAERHVLYRWVASSGKELLVYNEPYWYNLGITPDIAIGLIELSELCGGLKTGLIVYGVGNHGGGPTRRDIERAQEMQEWPVFPKIKFGTMHEFYKKAESVRDKLPIHDKEINFIFTGCYTTQSRIKLGNRKSEAALLDAGSFNAMSSLIADYEYPGDKLRRAWQGVLLTHFHDILTGSTVQETREHAIGIYADAIAVANTSRENATRAISNQIDTSMIIVDTDIADTLSEGAGAGYGIEDFSGVPNPERGKGKVRIFNVFNPNTKERSDIAELTIWDWVGDKSRIEVTDHAGNKLPFQLVPGSARNFLEPDPTHGDNARYWDHFFFRVLVEVTVPALGYITVVLKENEHDNVYPFYFNPFPRSFAQHDPVVLENDHLKATFSPRDGSLVSLIDKKTETEQIKCCSGGGGLVLCSGEADTNNAWLIGRILGREPVTKTIRLRPMKPGDLRNGFVMEQEILSSKIVTTVTLDRNSNALAYSFDIFWHEYSKGDENVAVLTFALPLANTPDAYQTDIAAGSIRRPALYEDVAGLQYAAAVTGDRAVAIVNDCKYGYRGCEDILHSTLINTANRPDLYPEFGRHKVNLWVAVDSSDPKVLQETAAQFCRPMNYLSVGSHKGALEPAGSLLELSAKSTVTSAVDLTCDGSLLVRVYETCGKADKVTLRLPFEAKSAVLVDLCENVLGEAVINGQNVSFPVEANCIAAVKISK